MHDMIMHINIRTRPWLVQLVTINKRTPVLKMVSIQAGDELPSDSDAELHYSSEKLNGHGPPLSHRDHSPEHQPIVSAVGGTSNVSPVRKATYPPPDFKDE